MLDEPQEQILRNLRKADGCDFATLVKIAGLDPRRDLREADLRGVDFGASDLRGFDFTYANLNGAKLDKANTVGAIFDKALIDNVIWPSFVKTSRSRDRAADHQLHPVQLEALRRILEALHMAPRQGGLVSMPAGTGRAAVVERLLLELNEGRRYSDVLLVVETAAEREQYLARLGGVLSRRFEARSVPSRNDQGSLTVEVATLGALRFALKEQDNAALRRLLKMGLIIASCNPGYVLSTAQLMKKSHIEAPILGFTDFPDRGLTLQVDRQIVQLKELLGDFLYVLGIGEALANRLLVEAVVEHRQVPVVELTMDRSKPSDSLLNDLTYQIVERSQSTQCLIICQNVEAVEFVASTLSDRLDGVSSKRVLAISSRSAQPEFWAAVDKQGAVLVMTPAMAIASTERAIWSSGLIAVLTAVGPSLSDRLRFRPRRASGSPDIILDYTNSVN